MTIVRKDYRNNWSATDHVDLVANRVLVIGTTKTSDGTIVTRASVHVRDGVLLYALFSDFSQRLMTTKDRCTEKNVIAQHACAMTKLNEIHSAITAHYAKEETVAA